MQYLGGKSKTRKQIASILSALRLPGQIYIEPFVGGAWVLQEMSGVRIASDINPHLIVMYQELQRGWIPPDHVTEEEWRQCRKSRYEVGDPMIAFAGFGCSFGGKFMAGYARGKRGRNYAAATKRNLIKQLPLIMDVEFRSCSYLDYTPSNALIYCDPPYANTTSYGGAGEFDSALFWETMREWAKDNIVVVSEYVAPVDFTCIAEFPSRMGLAGGNRPIRTERLFMKS